MTWTIRAGSGRKASPGEKEDPRTRPAPTGAFARRLGENGWLKSGSPRRGQGYGSVPSTEEAAMAYDVAAVRLYGPEAYFNLPRLRRPSVGLIAYNNKAFRFKWFPSRNFISMFPSRGFSLNLSAQPSVHVIHHRLEELKKKGNAAPSPASSFIESKTGAPLETHATVGDHLMVGDNTAGISTEKTGTPYLQEENPQLDLNEFLQQLGILKKNSEQEKEEINIAGAGGISSESLLQECDRRMAFEDMGFNWDPYMDLRDYADKQEEQISAFQIYR